jgi:hypothetical protein
VGRFYPEITIERGLTARLKKAHARRRKKGGRPREDPTTITVRDMSIGQVAAGRFFVRSSNLDTPPLAAGWSAGARARLENRRRDGDGEAKGRVLYGILETTTETMVVAAVCYHIASGGQIVILSLDATTELNDYRAKLCQLLVIAVDRIALEKSGGKPCRVRYEASREDARWARDNLENFRTAGREKNRVILTHDVTLTASRRTTVRR